MPRDPEEKTSFLTSENDGKHLSNLACPQCGINAIVQHGDSYVCLNCGFRRNVSNSTLDPLPALGVLAAITVVIFLILTSKPQQNENNNQQIGFNSSLSATAILKSSIS